MSEVSAAGGGGPGPGPTPRGMMCKPLLRLGMRAMGPADGRADGAPMGVSITGGPPIGGGGGGIGGRRPITGPMGMDPGFVSNMNAMMLVTPGFPLYGPVFTWRQSSYRRAELILRTSLCCCVVGT